MSLTRFDLPALLTELIDYTLAFLTEQEVLWFAQTSKENTKIAHRVLLGRGMSHWPWRKLLGAATMQPDRTQLTDTLVLQRTHQPRDNIFDEAARALFLLAKKNQQIVTVDQGDQWIDELLSAYVNPNKQFAAGNILSVLIPIMTDTQFAKMFTVMFYKQIKLPDFKTSSLPSYTTNLLQLMSLRLNTQQLADCCQHKNVLDMMDIVVSAEHAERVFNNIVHPFLTFPGSILVLDYFYGFGKRSEMFLKLHQHLNPKCKQLAVSDVRSALRHYYKHVAKNAYRLMQSMAPDVLKEEVQAGVEKLRRHLMTRKDGKDIGAEWQQVLEEFGAMAPGLTAVHLDIILRPMVGLFTAWSGTTQGKESFEEYGLKLFGEIAFCMSDLQVTTILTVVEKILTRDMPESTQNQAFFARAQLLKRVDVDKRRSSIGWALTMYHLYHQTDAGYTLDIIMALAQDLSEIEAEGIFPKLQTQLLDLRDHHDGRYMADVAKEAFTALIPRLSKDTLLKWIATWKDNPWLFLRCLYLRTQDLDNEVLMDFMPQVIGWLGNRGEDPGLPFSNMAQAILVSFTSRPNVMLLESLLLLIHEILKANPFKAEPYNVWCHLMTLGKYDLHPLNTLLPRHKTGLNQLIHLIEAASSDELTATPLASQAPQASSASVISSGLSFFRFIPRQPQPSVLTPTRAAPQ